MAQYKIKHGIGCVIRGRAWRELEGRETTRSRGQASKKCGGRKLRLALAKLKTSRDGVSRRRNGGIEVA